VGLVAGVLAVLAAGSVGAVLAISRSGPAGISAPAGAAQWGPAATWVAGQLDPATVVSCDPAMCAALVAHGYPSKNIRKLSSATALKASGVVVVTPAAQQLFGSSLVTAWAPDALATFGPGSSATSVRIVAPHGATRYEQAARQDQAARASFGAALLQARSITVAGSAAQELKSGQADGRLMEAIADAAAAAPIHIVEFGNAGSGASADVPLRYADLAASDSAASMGVPAYIQALRAGMAGGPGPRPARTQLLTLPGGQQVLRVEFLAPSPLGVLNSP
jgi:hypothetical protein